MLTIINDNTDPRFNLALEEYLLKHISINDDFILLWRNDKSIILGRNQNPFEEINMSYVKAHDIPIIRRISGGGTVYHDLGNINYTFITKDVGKNLNNYKVFIDPMIDILRELGVKCFFKKESDIYVGEKKISGNAQTFYKNKMIHHGTILFNADLDAINKIPKVSSDYNSKAIKSRVANTTNIMPLLSDEMDIHKVIDTLRRELFDGSYSEHLYQLTLNDMEKIKALMVSKYSSWEWNFGETPEFIIKKEFDNRMLITLLIKKGIIRDITIDCFENVMKLEHCLLNVKLEENALRDALQDCTSYDTEKLIQTILY